MKLRLRHSANTKCCLPQRSLPDVNPSRSHIPPRDLVERTDGQLEKWLVKELVLRAEECDQVRTREGSRWLLVRSDAEQGVGSYRRGRKPAQLGFRTSVSFQTRATVSVELGSCFLMPVEDGLYAGVGV